MQTTTDSISQTQLIRQVSDCSVSHEIKLPEDFKPSATHILCGRTKDCFNHAGNRHFRDCMSMFVGDYRKCRSKVEKSLVVMKALNFIQEGHDGSRFIKQDKITGQWFELRKKAVKEKVGHAIRDIINNREKTARRRNTRKQMHNKPNTTESRAENDESDEYDEKGADILISNLFGYVSEDESNSIEPVPISENLDIKCNHVQPYPTSVVPFSNVASVQVKRIESDGVAIAPVSMNENIVSFLPRPIHRCSQRISLTEEEFDENDSLILKGLFEE